MTIAGLLSSTLLDTGAAGLIPAFIGVPIVALGSLGRINYEQRKPLLISALVLAAIGFALTVGDVRYGLYLVSVGPVHVANADLVVTNSLVAIVAGAYLYGGIRWLLALQRTLPNSNL